ncbi:MAG: hypothetical protein QM770_17775 [Tepidisphaeraceae bacterium]
MLPVRFQILALLTLGNCIASTASAQPFEPARVPDEVSWVVHVDVEQVSTSSLWKTLESTLRENARLGAKLQQVERAVGVKLPGDVQDVTVFGTYADEVSYALVVRSHADHERLATLASLNPTYRKETASGRKIHRWQDGRGEHVASFATSGELVLSGDEALLDTTLDLLEHKPGAKSLEGQIPFTPKPTDAVTVYLGGSALGAITARDKGASIFTRPMRCVFLTAHEAGDQVVIDGNVLATDARSAELLRNVVEGFRSLAVLASKSDAPIEEKARKAGEMLDRFKSSVQNDRIDFEWTLPTDMIQSAVTERLEDP